MEYTQTVTGRFIARPNRFIAHVEINGAATVCHVKNTGRCRELLTPGAKVVLEKSSNPNRKTAYDLVCVYKGDLLINMDSQAPNKVFYEWVKSGGFLPNVTLMRPETTYGASRFDCYIEQGDKRHFVEVKGVTLEEDGFARFPDAPTARGVKHIEELIHAHENGYESWIVFVIQMASAKQFSPNWDTHAAFGEALQKAQACGVHILAKPCSITQASLSIVDVDIPIDLIRR